MCGRYSVCDPERAFAEFSVLEKPPRIEPRFNVAPTQLVPIVRTAADGVRRIELLRWGLEPRSSLVRGGARPARPPVIMVRVESLMRGAFASSLCARRCIFVADGFYEWERIGRGKVAHFIRWNDGAPLAIAGIWEPGAGEGPDRCALITKPAVAPIVDLHDRMPATVAHGDYERWLDPTFADSRELERMLGGDIGLGLSLVAVGPRVNSVANDDASCIEPGRGVTGALFGRR